MAIFVALTIILFIPSLITIHRNMLLATYLWQIKEYKLNRFQNYILHNEDPQTISRLVRPVSFILLFACLIFLANSSLSFLIVLPLLVFGYFTFETLRIFAQFIGKRLVMPKKSLRNLMIMAGGFLFTTAPVAFLVISFLGINLSPAESGEGIFSGNLFEVQQVNGINVIPLSTFILFFYSITSLLFDILSPFIVSLFVAMTFPFAFVSHKILVDKAKKKLKEFPNLKVIAVTGSYGKSTTKEILYELLKDKFKVTKTPKNFNTDIGIAQTILSDLKSGTEIFIAEMGAYRIGEIKRATKVLRPDIAVVTGVNEQHVSLFGSIENTFKAKYEIVEALPEDGVAILNGNNEYTIRMAEKSTHKEIMYFTSLKDEVAAGVAIVEAKSKFPDASRSTLIAADIEKVGGKVSFKLLQNNNKFTMSVPLSDVHNVSNLLAAMAACLEVGLSFDEVIKIVEKAEFKLPHLNMKSGINDSEIIDDSYNTNPDGFVIALKKLGESKKSKRIAVTQGIIELGAHKGTVYKRIAPAISSKATCLVTNDELLCEIVDEEGGEIEIIFVKSESEMLGEIISKADRDTVFLFEGNIPPRIKEQTVL